MDVKRYRHQHMVLLRYIQYALQCWGPLDDPSVSYWFDDMPRSQTYYPEMEVTPELKRVLMRARILSEDCCMEVPFLKAILYFDDDSERFVDIVKEIQWCTSVVYNGRKLNRGTRRVEDFPWLAEIGYQEDSMLEGANYRDWLQLLTSSTAHFDKHHEYCSAEECGNMHGREYPNYCLMLNFVKYGQTKLWSFDAEVVKQGRTLGSGAFSFVSEVSWLGLKFAQKNFNATGLHSLPAEAEVLRNMNHPHIVKVYAYSENSLLMDLMTTDLNKFLKSRMRGGARIQPFSYPAAIDLMLQIAEAVRYVHSLKVAHRDLKSSNILVNPVNTPNLNEDDGFVLAKIADFGMAKTKREITNYSHLTHNVGTRRWMAPEIFGANMEDDHLEHAFPMKADVYSFGIICFEILTGKEPFSGEPLTTLYLKLTAPIPLRPKLPSSYPTNLASLIYKCWDVDPGKRPMFGDVCQVLRYLKGLPTLIDLEVWIDLELPFGRLTPMIKKHWTSSIFGKLGKELIFSTSNKILDILGVECLFKDLSKSCLVGFNCNSRSIGGIPERERVLFGRNSKFFVGNIERISFQYPYEFLVQVEGSISPLFGIVSLSFITTRQKYGPYGIYRGETSSFCSDRGRVVGFDVYSNPMSLEVRTIPKIVGCLRQYLGFEESIA